MPNRIATIVVIATTVLPTFALANHSEEISVADVPMGQPCSLQTNLGLGSRGTDVICLQEHLIKSGHLRSGIPMGYFGSLTKAALAAWQGSHGVPSTGYFGSMSRAVLSGAAVPMMEHQVSVMDTHASSASATDTHTVAHASIDVAQWQSIPKVSIVAHKDAMSGYNLEIKTENFRFAPEHASGAVLPNEGHAHLMIDGKKLARVYGNWFHIPVEALSAGTPHEVLLTLNANDHSELSINGVHVQATSTVSL